MENMSNVSSIIHSTNVYLYQYDVNLKTFQQVGNGVVGGVILGTNTLYSLLFYNGQKERLCQTKITSKFQYTIQQSTYINFYDDGGKNWSIRFKDDFETITFCRILALTKIHVGRWSQPSIDMNQIHIYELCLGKEGTPVTYGDTVGSKILAWKLGGVDSSKPTGLLQETPFEQTGEKDYRKIKLAKNGDPIPGLVEGLVGMNKGGKRIILTPPNISNSGWLLIEVDIQKVKLSDKKAGSTTSVDTPPFIETSSLIPSSVSDSSTTSSSHKTLVQRMAQLSRMGSTHSGILAEALTPQLSQRNIITHNLVPNEETNSLSSPSIEHAQNELAKEKEKLKEQQDKLLEQKKALDEAKSKMLSEQLDAQLQQIKEEQGKLQNQRLEHQRSIYSIPIPTFPPTYQMMQQPSLSPTHASIISPNPSSITPTSHISLSPPSYSTLTPPINSSILPNDSSLTSTHYYGLDATNNFSSSYSTPLNSISSYSSSPLNSTSLTTFNYSNQPTNGINSNLVPSSSLTGNHLEMETLQKIQRVSSTIEESLSDVHVKVDKILHSVRMNNTNQRNNNYNVNGITTNVSSSISKYSDSSSSSSNILKHIEQLISDNECMKNELIDKNNQLNNVQAKVDDILEKNHDLMFENNRLNDKTNSFQQQENYVKNQLNLAQSSKEAFEKKNSQLENEIQQLKRSLEQTQHTETQNNRHVEYERSIRQRAEEAYQRENQSRMILEKQFNSLQEQTRNQHINLIKEWEIKIENEKKSYQSQLLNITQELEVTRNELNLRSNLENKLIESRKVAQDLQMELNKSCMNEKNLKDEKNKMLDELEKVKIKLYDLQNEKKENVDIKQLNQQYETIIQEIKEKHQNELKQAIIQAKEEEFQMVEQQFSKDVSMVTELKEEIEQIKQKLKQEKEQHEVEKEILQNEIKDEKQNVLNCQIEMENLSNTLKQNNNFNPNEIKKDLSLGNMDRDEVSELFKEFMNDVYFRFQDYFQEEHEFNGKQVIVSIRKILKESTVDVLKKIEGIDSMDGSSRKLNQ